MATYKYMSGPLYIYIFNFQFKINDICKFAEKFYPQDFTVKELGLLRCQLELFEFEVHQHDLDIFQNMSTISELCQVLIKTDITKTYYLIDRLIHLALSLLVLR